MVIISYDLMTFSKTDSKQTVVTNMTVKCMLEDSCHGQKKKKKTVNDLYLHFGQSARAKIDPSHRFSCVSFDSNRVTNFQICQLSSPAQ